MADLKTTLQARQSVQMQKARLMLDQAERETRGLTTEEETLHAAILADIGDTTRRLDKLAADDSFRAEVDRLMPGFAHSEQSSTIAAGGGARHAGRRASLGAQFVASETYKWLTSTRNSRPAGAWSSPSSELMATQLDESTGSGGPLVIPQVLPGILSLPQPPLNIADLLGQGQADSNAILYLREKTFTNAAAATAEGAVKPESALVFESVTEPVRKIATFLPVSEELTEDQAQLMSYLDSRLSLGVSLSLNDELLNGTGTAPHLTGLLQRVGLSTPVARGALTNADAILTMLAQIQNSVFVRPDGIVMHPTNWNSIQLLKDANGNYIGGFAAGPFAAPHALSLWGLPVVLSAQIAVGTALVGCFQTQAQLFRRGGLRVESTNSHLDFFQRNLIAIRAELRAALAVYRPAAFGVVTGLL